VLWKLAGEDEAMNTQVDYIANVIKGLAWNQFSGYMLIPFKNGLLREEEIYRTLDQLELALLANQEERSSLESNRKQ
jgi:hypothetical protein